MTIAAGHRLTFGVKTSQAGIGYEEIVRTWREAEQVGVFEHAWLWDHLVPLRGDVRGPALEAWTLGVIVTSNRIRPPAVLAKMAATVDVISGGRLEFGIGAGGSLQPDPALTEMVRREYDAYGIEVVRAGEAVAALGEACTIVKRMWSEDQPFDFDGRFYRMTGAICEPKPLQHPRPPILIGAGGERVALRVVAEHADIWNSPTRTTAEFAHKSQVLDEHCATIGRNPADIVRSVQVLVRPSEPAAAAAARELLLELIDAGARHLVLAAVPPAPPQPVHWLAAEIVEPVLAQVAPTRAAVQP